MVYSVYLLTNDASHSYVGYTSNLSRRTLQHNGALAGGAKRTRQGRPWRLHFAIEHIATQKEAMQLEYRIKAHRGLAKRLARMVQETTAALPASIPSEI